MAYDNGGNMIDWKGNDTHAMYVLSIVYIVKLLNGYFLHLQEDGKLYHGFQTFLLNDYEALIGKSK